MIVTIPIDLPIDDEIHGLKMDVLYRMVGGASYVTACFIEEIPSPSGYLQSLMQAKAEEYLNGKPNE